MVKQTTRYLRCFLLDVGDAGPFLQLRVQVPVRKRHEPPAHGEQQPAADERGGEDDQGETPFQVHQRGEDVLQESALLPDVLVRQVARTVFGDEARFVHAVPENRLTGQPRDESGQTELLWDDAFSRQHLLEVGKTLASAVRLYARKPAAAERAKTHQLLPDIWGRFGWSARRLRWDGTVPPVLLT